MIIMLNGTSASGKSTLQFFKEKLKLEDWRVKVAEPCKYRFAEHNARIDIFLEKDQLKDLMTKYIAAQNLIKRSSSSSSPASSGFSQSFWNHFPQSKIDQGVTVPTVMTPRKLMP